MHVALIGCLVLGVALSRVRLEFINGFQRLELSPDSAFVVFAAITLPPAAAAGIGGCVALGATHRRPVRMRMFTVLFACCAAGYAGFVVHAITPSGRLPSAEWILPIALIAASVRTLIVVAGTLARAELQQRNGAMSMLQSTPLRALFALELLLPTATIAMAWAYIAHVWAALAALAACQAFTWHVLRMAHARFSEQAMHGQLRSQVARYLPQTVASGLMATERQPGAAGDTSAPLLGGELREITVMFIDIRSFTSWAETTEPDDVMAELNRLLTDLTEAILATDGTIDKFTGDGLMAFWGAPIVQENHAARALQAVPHMLMRVREMNIRRSVQRSRALEIGIGINTGVAMIGNVGHHERLSYTAVGDTVNLAARLEQATRTHDVPLLVSEDTFLALPLSMQRQLQRLDSIAVKGRRDRVRLYTPTMLARRAQPAAAS